MPSIITTSSRQTFELGKKLASQLKSGLVLALIGDLGAGKTVFAQGVGAGLGIDQPITSPTFVIMKIYPLPKPNNLKQFCHIDAYRLKDAQELINIGADEYLKDPQTITLIEWAEKVKTIWPTNTKIITFKHLAKTKREIKI